MNDEFAATSLVEVHPIRNCRCEEAVLQHRTHIDVSWIVDAAACSSMKAMLLTLEGPHPSHKQQTSNMGRREQTLENVANA